MKTSAVLINIILVAIALTLTFLWYPQLPDFIPTHWNFQGEIDSYSPKFPGAFLIPAISLAMLIGFWLFPKLDPNKEKYRLFQTEWAIIQVGLIAFFVFLHAVTLSAAIHSSIEVGILVSAGIGALFILLGNYLGKIRQNWFLGVRTPWTLSNEHVWNKTHRFAGWTFVGAGLIVLIGTALGLYSPALFFSAILLGGLLPVLYSLFIYKDEESLFKKLLIGASLILTVFLFLRLLST